MNSLFPLSNPVFGLHTPGGALNVPTKSGLTNPASSIRIDGGSFGRRAIEFESGGRSDRQAHSWPDPQINRLAFVNLKGADHFSGDLPLQAGACYRKLVSLRGRLVPGFGWSAACFGAHHSIWSHRRPSMAAATKTTRTATVRVAVSDSVSPTDSAMRQDEPPGKSISRQIQRRSPGSQRKESTN